MKIVLVMMALCQSFRVLTHLASPTGRVSLKQFFFGTNCENDGAIHLQRGNCGAASRSQPKNAYIVPCKMILPALLTWIEDGCLFVTRWINGGELSRFVQRTSHTCQRQILEGGFTLFGHRDYMVNVKRCGLAFLSQLAIFAPVDRALNDLATQRSGNVTHLSQPQRIVHVGRAQVQQRKKFGQCHQPFGFRTFGHSQSLSLVLTIQQRLQSRLHGIGQFV